MKTYKGWDNCPDKLQTKDLPVDTQNKMKILGITGTIQEQNKYVLSCKRTLRGYLLEIIYYLYLACLLGSLFQFLIASVELEATYFIFLFCFLWVYSLNSDVLFKNRDFYKKHFAEYYIELERAK